MSCRIEDLDHRKERTQGRRGREFRGRLRKKPRKSKIMNNDRVLTGDMNTASNALLILYDAVRMRKAYCGGSERSGALENGGDVVFL